MLPLESKEELLTIIRKLSFVYIFIQALCLAIYCDCYRDETYKMLSAFKYFNASVTGNGRFADQLFPS